MNKIIISTEGINLTATLNDTLTAHSIFDILPIEGKAKVWGEEIYFEIPLQLKQDSDAKADVEVGELGYWPVGSAFCIFFGPTPVSTDEKPRAYSPVNVFGKIEGDAKQLKKVPDGAVVGVTKPTIA